MSEGIFDHLVKHIAHVERDVASTVLREGLCVGGRMSYFTVAHDTIELVQAVRAAIEISLPYQVVGAQSVSIFPDDGYPGLVIMNASNSIAFSADHSQMVVDGGVTVRKAVLQAATAGLGGLIPFYAERGSIASLLFRGASVGGDSLISHLRSLTLLMPPTKVRPEPTIVRYKSSWLLPTRQEEASKLAGLWQRQREQMPIILTAQFQLTSLRHDELSRRIQHVAAHEIFPPEPHFGPLFMPPSEGNLADILKGSDIRGLRHPGLFLHKHAPNFLGVSSRYLRDRDGRLTQADVVGYAESVISRVKEVTGVELQPAYLVH